MERDCHGTRYEVHILRMILGQVDRETSISRAVVPIYGVYAEMCDRPVDHFVTCLVTDVCTAAPCMLHHA